MRQKQLNESTETDHRNRKNGRTSQQHANDNVEVSLITTF